MEQLFLLVLENPMDLVLAHKRSIKTGEMLGLSISLQTSFTTAISEVTRVIFDSGYTGELSIGVQYRNGEYYLVARLTFRHEGIMNIDTANFAYARKLVREFRIHAAANPATIELEVPVPRTARITPARLNDIVKFFEQENPDNFYEVIKRRNTELDNTAKQKEAALLQSQVINEQKNEFLALASHELKTPLAILKGYSYLALSECEGCSPAMKDFLLKIDQQAGKLNSLITQLLNISKIEIGQMVFNFEQTAINSYLTDELAQLKIVLPTHRIKITLGEDVVMKIDRLRMAQVLSNLLSNAAKYSNNHTVIEFTSAIADDHFMHFSVKDEGIGMSEENARRIFEKFYRAEKVVKKYSGLGMGLYIASKIVNEHGGKMWLETREGAGSTFYFSLPYLAQ